LIDASAAVPGPTYYEAAAAGGLQIVASACDSQYCFVAAAISLPIFADGFSEEGAPAVVLRSPLNLVETALRSSDTDPAGDGGSFESSFKREVRLQNSDSVLPSWPQYHFAIAFCSFVRLVETQIGFCALVFNLQKSV
jgi:hypothetical protein